MSLNLQMEGASSGAVELPGSSDYGPLVLALREIMKKELDAMIISSVERLIVPMMESLVRKVVREEIQSAQQMHMTRDNGSLQLKFLDEVSVPVLTGKEIKGKGDTAMRLAVVDNTTGDFVNSGPEASAKVEISLLEVNEDDDETNWSTEDFNNKVIRKSDNKKPHFAKDMYVKLKGGLGLLHNAKLGHHASWMKRCRCRLGARFVDNVGGSRVKEAWTESFMVEDSRGKLYVKHDQPSLSDEVWRLKNIGKKVCKDLNEAKIFTVRDFLFLLSIDPQRLQKIFAGSKVWEATVDHARKCIIDDKKIYLYDSPSKFNFVVAFDAVAQLRGIVRDSHYDQLDNLSEVEKASAQELLLLAFENRQDITSIDDENALVHRFTHKGNDTCVDTNSVNVRVEPCTSYPTIDPSSSHSHNFDTLVAEPESIQRTRDPSLTVPEPSLSSDLGPLITLDSNLALSDPYYDLNYLEHFDDYENLASLLSHLDNSHSETFTESRSSQQSNAAGSIRFFAAVALTLWLSRVRKRILGVEDFSVQKRQRIG